MFCTRIMLSGHLNNARKEKKRSIVFNMDVMCVRDIIVCRIDYFWAHCKERRHYFRESIQATAE